MEILMKEVMLFRLKNPSSEYIEILTNEFKKYSGPFKPSYGIEFTIKISLDEHSETPVLKGNCIFYYVEGGNIVMIKDGKFYPHNYEITHFKLGNGESQPIENFNYHSYCRYSCQESIFVPIGKINDDFFETTLEEIKSMNLIKKEL